MNKTLKTIYLGGGTPSVLNTHELGYIFSTITKCFNIEKDAEITLEANPDDLTIQNLKNYREIGINRLSIGIQSFDNQELKAMNRNHTAEQAISCIENTRIAGFDNINIDLIYSIPNSTMESLRLNVDKAISFQPEHISAYCLTVEDGTTFGNWLKKGKITELDDNDSFGQYSMLIELLSNNGLEQYEISNFSKPGYRSKHNSNYWENSEYLGIGPSAHSYDGKTRYSNISNNPNYISKIKNGEEITLKETLTHNEKINEYLMTGLRKSVGVDTSELNNKFGYEIISEKGKELDLLYSSNLANFQNGKIILTTKGKFVSNSILAMLIK